MAFLPPGSTFKEGRVFIRALEVALLAQLLADAPAGDVGLHAEAVALSTVQASQLDHVGLGDVLFLGGQLGVSVGGSPPAGVGGWGGGSSPCPCSCSSCR